MARSASGLTEDASIIRVTPLDAAAVSAMERKCAKLAKFCSMNVESLIAPASFQFMESQ